MQVCRYFGRYLAIIFHNFTEFKIFASVANPFTEVSAMHVITCFVKFDTY